MFHLLKFHRSCTKENLPSLHTQCHKEDSRRVRSPGRRSFLHKWMRSKNQMGREMAELSNTLNWSWLMLYTSSSFPFNCSYSASPIHLSKTTPFYPLFLQEKYSFFRTVHHYFKFSYQFCLCKSWSYYLEILSFHFSFFRLIFATVWFLFFFSQELLISLT